ncbi:MAG: formate--tetrahydrofolate ligase [Deltaproteobacteria bacterium]|nr:formate--tetrahydrofolate ligase [Deltaproteobacteria bacterium]
MEKAVLPPDIEIARAAKMQPIEEIAAKLGIGDEDLEHYGKVKAKVNLGLFHRKKDGPRGKLILVTAMNPTPAGEGKTTTTIGLGDALNRIGKKTVMCLREPSLGPCFGVKGGAAGGGYAQVVPMEDINLHFTGDFHAIGLAHNLLSAMLDNHIHQGNSLGIDPRRILWNRVLDMNDRALRGLVIGLGGPGNSMPRESGFDITVASEVMAIFCLSESLEELKERLGRMIVGHTYDRKTITAADLKAHGAMTVLLKGAIHPNLVQTLENNPVFIHGGPFANIAHGCNSVIATKLALALAEYTVTEAGFGADLGAEKFFNIKCRKAGIHPDAVVIVATIRALKYHGGVDLKEIGKPNMEALEKGIENLKKHIENIRRFGLPAIVAINAFSGDTAEEITLVQDKCAYLGVEVVPCRHWAEGSAGAEDLARAVVSTVENTKSDFTLLYPDSCDLWQKVEIVAREIYGAVDILADKKLRDKFKAFQAQGYGGLPVCIAKTQYSLSTDPGLRGRPKTFDLPLRDIRLSAGAGFLVVLTGDIMTMPGLPKAPAAETIDVNSAGETVGLF